MRPKLIVSILASLFALAIIVVGYKAIVVKKMNIWFGDYLSQAFSSSPDADKATRPQHLIVMYSDHFEPAGNIPYLEHWIAQFRASREHHRDADGRHPQHTFFYPCEQFRDQEMDMLDEVCRAGFGEVELQWHHAGDTPASLTIAIRQAIDDFSRHGWFVTATEPPDTTFGFVHGNFALDNSRTLHGKDLCGVENELILLRELGCYADFTFPAVETTAQPSIINKFYYAVDDPNKPKSYDTGTPMEVGKAPSGDLLIMPGLLTIDWSNWSHIFYPAVEYANITHEIPASATRADFWVSHSLHVQGQPNWRFVKLFSHGAVKADSLAIWGPGIDAFYSYLETRYNDGADWVLHYVSAREMYNMAKAAEAGHTGNPNDFRDFLISPYRAMLTIPEDSSDYRGAGE